MSRYEIRVQEASEVCKSYGLYDDLYVVWDTVEDRRVPFGNYSNREHALARIARMESR